MKYIKRKSWQITFTNMLNQSCFFRWRKSLMIVVHIRRMSNQGIGFDVIADWLLWTSINDSGLGKRQTLIASTVIYCFIDCFSFSFGFGIFVCFYFSIFTFLDWVLGTVYSSRNILDVVVFGDSNNMFNSNALSVIDAPGYYIASYYQLETE